MKTSSIEALDLVDKLAEMEEECLRLHHELEVAQMKMSRSETKVKAIRRHLEWKIANERRLEDDVDKAFLKINAAKTLLHSQLRNPRANVITREMITSVLAILEDSDSNTEEKDSTSSRVSYRRLSNTLGSISEENPYTPQSLNSAQSNRSVSIIGRKKAVQANQNTGNILDANSSSCPAVSNENGRQAHARSAKPSDVSLQSLGMSNGDKAAYSHNWYVKTVIRRETCKACGQRIDFAKQFFKCDDCKSACHSDCLTGHLSIPCVSTEPNNNTATSSMSSMPSNALQTTPKSEKSYESHRPPETPCTPKVRGAYFYFATPAKGKSVLQLRKSRLSTEGFPHDRSGLRPRKCYFD